MGRGSRTGRWARRFAAPLALALAAGCSGSAEGPTSTTAQTTTSTTTTTEPTTTTTATPRPPADAESVELAEAAALRAEDAGDAWSVHTEGGPRLLTDQSCSHRDGGPESKLGEGAAQDGPRLQLGDEHAFIASSSFAFPTEQKAVEWIQTVATSEWSDCTLERLHERDLGGSADLEVELDSRQIEHLGENGFEAFAQFYGRGEDGTVALVVNVMHYRMGTVVLENTLVRDAALDPSDWAAVDTAHGSAVAAAWDRLNELR